MFAHIDDAFQTDSGLPQSVLYDKGSFVHKNLQCRNLVCN